LSIVSAIAASHHGTATAANHPDGGAIFTVELPLGDLPLGDLPLATEA
jgi:signal transduction histidine kinase